MKDPTDIPDALFADDERPSYTDVDRENADRIAHAFLGPKMGQEKPKKSTKTISDSVWARLKIEAGQMMETGNWRGAGPRHWVAAYALCHTRVYGVEPVELTPTERLNATFMATRLFEREFGADAMAMADFMRWVWIREESREKWRKQNNANNGSRLGWHAMFSGKLLTDYRIANTRKAAPR